jgi:hypothetical protein
LRVMKIESTNLTVVSFWWYNKENILINLLGGRHFDETTGHFE